MWAILQVMLEVTSMDPPLCMEQAITIIPGLLPITTIHVLRPGDLVSPIIPGLDGALA